MSASLSESPNVKHKSKGILYLEARNFNDPLFPPSSGANPTNL